MADDSLPRYSNWLVVATTIFLVWTILLCGVRTWARLRRSSWSLQDNFFAGAFIAAIAQVITVYLAVSRGLWATNAPTAKSSNPEVLQLLYASSILYVISIGLSRCSTALLLSSLIRNQQQKTSTLVLAALAGLWTIAALVAIALMGNLPRPWALPDDPDNLYKRWLGVEVSGLAIELVLWCQSMFIVHGLNMKLWKRLQVVGLFGARLILVPIICGRLYFLHETRNDGTPFADVMALIFTEGAMFAALIAECMTSLKPFLQAFHSGWDVSSGSHHYSNPSRDPYAHYTNTSMRSWKAKGALRTTESEIGGKDGSLKLRADNIGFEADVVSRGSKPNRSYRSTTDEEDDIELLQRPENAARIQQVRTISVVKEAAAP